MKKLNLKGKMFWGALAATTLITPLMIVSAVACVPQVKPFNKLNVVINTNPVNENLFINKNENLPILSVEAKVDNPNTQLSYQWYESDSNSTANGKAIPGAAEATYTLSDSDTQNVGTKYFYAVISISKDNAVLTSKISEIYTININQIPTININKQPLNQRVIIN